ncbi:MAG: CoA-acylating methylmalonate-semialdehyde dehydrogenase [Chloroflexota bacterium]
MVRVANSRQEARVQTAEPQTKIKTLENYIDGRWAQAPAGAGTLPVTNPATGEILARVPLSGAAAVDAAAGAAHAAYNSWQHVPPIDRARYLFELRDLVIAESEELARLITAEHGKTLADARSAVERAIENIEVASGMPSLMMGFGLDNGAGRDIDERAVRRPLGVFAAVAPFNFPMMVPFWFLPYAIATGNTFILKPSEQVPLSQQMVFRLLDQLSLPDGVVNLVNGGRETVEALLDHPLIRGISFVGSTSVARQIYARAAANGKRVQAAGGAKNVLVVMPDAVMEKTVPNIINAAFGSTGQRCLAGSVVVPVGDVHQPLREGLVEAMRQIRVGSGLDEHVTMGPVISPAARERIQTAIERGQAEGAELVAGGVDFDAPPGLEGGNWVQPTLFDRVRPEMRLAQDEIFGPVLAMMPAQDLDQALRFINRSPYGNAASIFTRDGGWARQFQRSLDVGNIGVNIGVAAPMAYFPFGGARDSFFGTQHGQGRDAVDFFTDRQIVISRWFLPGQDHAGQHW